MVSFIIKITFEQVVWMFLDNEQNYSIKEFYFVYTCKYEL